MHSRVNRRRSVLFIFVVERDEIGWKLVRISRHRSSNERRGEPQ